MIRNLGIGLLMATAWAPGATLVSNLGQPVRATSPTDALTWGAQSFITDSSFYTLTRVLAAIGDASGSPAGFAELRADASGTPDFSAGGLLGTFTLPSLTGAISDRILLPNAAMLLAPGTTYWLAIGSTGAGSFGWNYSEGNASTGPGSLGDYAYSFDGGATWGSYGSEHPFQIQVDVEEAGVPEPAFGVATAALALGLAVVRRRRASCPM